MKREDFMKLKAGIYEVSWKMERGEMGVGRARIRILDGKPQVFLEGCLNPLDPLNNVELSRISYMHYLEPLLEDHRHLHTEIKEQPLEYSEEDVEWQEIYLADLLKLAKKTRETIKNLKYTKDRNKYVYNPRSLAFLRGCPPIKCEYINKHSKKWLQGEISGYCMEVAFPYQVQKTPSNIWAYCVRILKTEWEDYLINIMDVMQKDLDILEEGE